MSDREAYDFRQTLELILAYCRKTNSTDLGKVLAIRHVAETTLKQHPKAEQ